MIRVFPRRTSFTPTDPRAFVGDPPLFRPEDDEVRISVAFSWDLPEGKRLARAWGAFYSHVTLGGPAFNDPGGEFEPGLYVRHGVTFTSRGCPKACDFCLVPKREGPIHELSIRDGWIIQDNNLLACSRPHIEAVFEMLRGQKRAAIFAGGLDAMLFQPWHLELINSIRVGELWCSCDSLPALKPLQHAAVMLADIPARKKRCYCLIGRESMAEAEWRLEKVYEMGFWPFAQLYRSDGKSIPYDPHWKALARKWCRPALYRRGEGEGEEVASGQWLVASG